MVYKIYSHVLAYAYLTFNKSRRVGATISCGTEFFRAFALGTVPVGRLFEPGDILISVSFNTI